MTTVIPASKIREKILNSKGSFVKARWKSEPKPAATHKGINLQKITEGVVRAGVDYSNLSAVKLAVESGERDPVGELPWGQWKLDEQGVSMFPYVIEHKGTDYIRLYPSDGNNHRCVSTYYVDGVEVSKETFASYLTPSEAKKILDPKEEDRPLCFTIKSDNILGLPQEVD